MFFSTSSRTKPNALRRSRPGFGRCSTSAAAKGLFFESPSDAVEPALAANAIIVFGLVGSTLARPRPIAREAMVRFMVLANGLSRQASRMTSRSCLAGSTANSTRSSGNALVENVGVGLERRVDRDQIVGAVQLDAVAGIIDHRHVGIARSCCRTRAAPCASRPR